jgi:UDP-glucuronate 4-epimerase
VSGRLVVTGAAGFIGSHACAALLAHGWDVVGIDNFDPYYARAIKTRSLGALADAPGFRFIEADVRDREAVEPWMRGADAVVHLAARAGVRPSVRDPVSCVTINVGGTAAVLDTMRRAGVKRLVLGSSASVYGEGVPLPTPEDRTPLWPASPYGASKRGAEVLCTAFTPLASLRVAILRLFSVYGPRQRPDQAIFRFTEAMMGGAAVERLGDGTSARDYTHVDDVVDALRAAVTWTAGAAPACETFNVGSGRPVTLDRLIATLGAALGLMPAVQAAPAAPADVRCTYADVAKAQRLLGFAPRVRFEDGINDFVEWFEVAYGSASGASR